MKTDEREIRRKLRVLERAEELGCDAMAYRYFGVPKSTFYRWRKAYLEQGEQGLINKKPIPGSHPNCAPFGFEPVPKSWSDLSVQNIDNVAGWRRRPFALIGHVLERFRNLL